MSFIAVKRKANDSPPNSKGAKIGGSCPYAVSIVDDDHSMGSSSTSDNYNDIMTMAKEKCPAFSASTGGCPFKNIDAADTNSIKQTLLQVPPSHTNGNVEGFQKSLRHLHQISDSISNNNNTNNGDEDVMSKYKLPGGCPVSRGPSLSFDKAMEDWSLAAIMANMAKEVEQRQEDNDDKAATTAATTGTIEIESKKSAISDNPSLETSSLAHALKQGTAQAHQAAEDVHFVHNFIQGKIDRDLYAKLILGLYFIYDKLEHELDVHAPTHFDKLHFPNQLSRKSALEEDVDFWHGPSILSSLSAFSNNNKNSTAQNTNNHSYISPATQDYLERMDHVAKNDPLLLLSHAYTRYLGDLSGGKILARVARRAMNLDKSGDGLQFYTFASVKNEKQFKDMYRTKLNELGLQLSQNQIKKLVVEANIAFILNMRIFEELDVLAAIPGSKVRPIEEALAFARNIHGSTEQQEELASAKCPFLVQKPDKHNQTAGNGNAESPVSMTAGNNKGARCPWPFVFFHDWRQGIQDWQTWVTIGVFLCWVWSDLSSYLNMGY